MMSEQERRAAGVKRVPVETVVEICGRDPGIPAFEAESVELSGRGMHVRTPYLPRLGAPLVCRLENGGSEIVVEGVVAWREEHTGGGEFGVKFTALDSGSVAALKDLCGMSNPGEQPESAANAPPEDRQREGAPVAPGAAVKLHIEGLGSPMRARVRRAGSRLVHVGSNLEFLKVGRGLELEDVDLGARVGAEIDSVSIDVDPQTQVPQLVVALRYEGAREDVTPEPSVVDAAPGGVPDDDDGLAHEAVMDPGEDDDAADLAEATAVRRRLEGLAAGAGRMARSTGALLGRAGAQAASGAGRFLKRAGTRLAEARASRERGTQRRRTARPPASPPEARRLRPQSAGSGRAARPEKAASPQRPLRDRRAAALGAAALAVVVGGGAYAMSGRAAETPPAVASVEAAPLQNGTDTTAPVGKAAPKNDKGVVAEVPLFGPTPMATMEPAPLVPPSDEGIGSADAPGNAAPAVADERFDDSPKQGAAVRPEDVPAWGAGRLHLPIIHRIRLDHPGAALLGEKRSDGFSVVIPDRKALDSGKTIVRADDRIQNVEAKNDATGTRITFRFRSGVPAYKVRLRKNNVEFFISAAEKSGKKR